MAAVHLTRTLFKELHEVLTQRKNRIIEDIHAVKGGKAAVLENQKNEITLVLRNIDSLFSVLKQNLQIKGEQLILENKAHLLETLDHTLVQAHQVSQKPVAASSHLTVEMNLSDIRLVFSRIGNISSVAATEIVSHRMESIIAPQMPLLAPRTE